MHKFTMKEVSAPDFDISVLVFDEEDVLSFRREINLLYETTLAEQRLQYAPKTYYYDYVSPHVILNKLAISDQAILSLIFIDGLMQNCLDETYIHNELISFKSRIRDSMYRMQYAPLLGNKIFSQSPYVFFSSYAFSIGIVNKTLVINLIKERGSNGFDLIYEHDLLLLLNLASPSDCAIFLESKSEKIRLATYQKMGALSYIDQMLLDKSAEIRRYAAEVMDYGDSRFKSLIKEKTKGVLCTAISKSPEGILPLFLVNPLIKKDYYVKSIFEKRMSK